MEVNKQSVSKRLKELRIKNGKTVEEWGNLFGLAKSSISRWENGTLPHRKTLEKISEKTGVSVNYILYGDFEEYIISFLERFPKTFEVLSKTNSFLSDLISYMNKNLYSYGDEEEIISYIFNNYPVYRVLLEEELITNSNRETLSLTDINQLAIENEPSYRFTYLEKLNELYSLMKQENLKKYTGRIDLLDILLNLGIRIEKVANMDYQPKERRELSESKMEIIDIIENIEDEYDKKYS